MPTDFRRQARARRHMRVREDISGTAQRPRLAVFRSLSHIYAQLIDDRAGRTLAAASDLEVKDKAAPAADRKSKSERAKAVGNEIAERAKAAGIDEVIFDRGGYRYHGRVKALADAARAGGLKF